MSYNSKLAITLLRNCSPDTPWEKKVEFLNDFCLRMKISGYPEQYRKNIIESALAAWDKIVLEDQFGLKPFYRSNDWKKEERRKEGKKEGKKERRNEGKKGRKKAIRSKERRKEGRERRGEEGNKLKEKSKASKPAGLPLGSSFRGRAKRSGAGKRRTTIYLINKERGRPASRPDKLFIYLLSSQPASRKRKKSISGRPAD